MVSGVQDNGLNINLLCMDEGKARDIDQLKISVSITINYPDLRVL